MMKIKGKKTNNNTNLIFSKYQISRQSLNCLLTRFFFSVLLFIFCFVRFVLEKDWNRFHLTCSTIFCCLFLDEINVGCAMNIMHTIIVMCIHLFDHIYLSIEPCWLYYICYTLIKYNTIMMLNKMKKSLRLTNK